MTQTTKRARELVSRRAVLTNDEWLQMIEDLLEEIESAEAKERTMLKKGDKVKTVYGKIETVMKVEDARVITYESASRNNWYHPTKVWKV